MYEKKCGERGKKFKQVNKDGMDENNKKQQGKDWSRNGEYTGT